MTRKLKPRKRTGVSKRRGGGNLNKLKQPLPPSPPMPCHWVPDSSSEWAQQFQRLLNSWVIQQATFSGGDTWQKFTSRFTTLNSWSSQLVYVTEFCSSPDPGFSQPVTSVSGFLPLETADRLTELLNSRGLPASSPVWRRHNRTGKMYDQCEPDQGCNLAKWHNWLKNRRSCALHNPPRRPHHGSFTFILSSCLRLRSFFHRFVVSRLHAWPSCPLPPADPCEVRPGESPTWGCWRLPQFSLSANESAS